MTLIWIYLKVFYHYKWDKWSIIEHFASFYTFKSIQESMNYVFLNKFYIQSLRLVAAFAAECFLDELPW